MRGPQRCSGPSLSVKVHSRISLNRVPRNAFLFCSFMLFFLVEASICAPLVEETCPSTVTWVNETFIGSISFPSNEEHVYSASSTCTWKIQPDPNQLAPGDEIHGICTAFTRLNVERFYDIVRVCGATESGALDEDNCHEYSGLYDLPTPQCFDSPVVFVQFEADRGMNYHGFSLDYYTNVTSSGTVCDRQLVMTGTTVDFDFTTASLTAGDSVDCTWVFLTTRANNTAGVYFKEGSSSSGRTDLVSFVNSGAYALENMLAPRQTHAKAVTVSVELPSYTPGSNDVTIVGEFISLTNYDITPMDSFGTLVDCSSTADQTRLCAVELSNNLSSSTFGSVQVRRLGVEFYQQTWDETFLISSEYSGCDAWTGPMIGFRRGALIHVQHTEGNAGLYSGWVFARFNETDDGLVYVSDWPDDIARYSAHYDTTTLTLSSMMAVPNTNVDRFAGTGQGVLPSTVAMLYTSSLLLAYPMMFNDTDPLYAFPTGLGHPQLLRLPSALQPKEISMTEKVIAVTGCYGDDNIPEMYLFARNSTDSAGGFVDAGYFKPIADYTATACEVMPVQIEYDEENGLTYVGLGVPNMNRLDVIVIDEFWETDIEVEVGHCIVDHYVVEGDGSIKVGREPNPSRTGDMAYDMLSYDMAGKRVLFYNVENVVNDRRALPPTSSVYCPPAPATCHVDAASAIAYAHPNRFLNPGILDEYTAHPTIMWSNGSLLLHTSTFRLSEVDYLIHSPKEYDCFAGTHRSEQYFGACVFCDPHTFSPFGEDACHACTDEQYCPAGAYAPLTYSALVNGTRTHSLGIPSETAVDFSSWVIDKASDFAELTVIVTVLVALFYCGCICSCCMVLESIAVLYIHVIKDQDRFKSKWHPMRWFEAAHSAFISFARPLDLAKEKFVPFNVNQATTRSRNGYYVSSRGNCTGFLMTPFFGIILAYLLIYAGLFFRSYTSDASSNESNAVVSTEQLKRSFIDSATTTLLDFDTDLGYTLYVKLMYFADMTCSGQCIESLTSTGCFTNNVPCQDLDYHCIGEYVDGDPDKGGNCTIVVEIPGIALQSTAQLAVDFGSIYTEAVEITVGHRVLGWESVSDGATDASDAATPDGIIEINTTDMIHFSKTSSVSLYNGSVMAGDASREWTNTPSARRIQHADLTGTRFRESAMSSFDFTPKPSFDSQTTTDYIISESVPMRVILDLETNIPVALTTKSRVLNISGVITALFVTVFAVYKAYVGVLVAAKYFVSNGRQLLKVVTAKVKGRSSPYSGMSTSNPLTRSPSAVLATF
ncbi:CUB domain [Carpediemonas membranifera]|uniref:CUB domain n=1 Tax=Carpediemonas membranifera TaxID=201153 RepID=A0A8J6BZR0_9EUKA|nr:CUB domain [Carpediemonas membranifera]|eukprot:KAG9395781.1 CUB domain [Carpediemonas membranifera]